MSIFKAPQITTEFTGDIEKDRRNMEIEHLKKSVKIYEDFFKVYMVVLVAIIVTTVVTLCLIAN